MKTLYLDASELTQAGAVGVFIKDTQIIPAGTTVYSMSIKDKNHQYQRYADAYDIHFIFDDEILTIDFFAVPQVDILATDSEGGFIGTVGQVSDLDSEAPICYISKDRKCFRIADNGREFLEHAASWKERKKPWDGITIYRTRAEAQKKLEFFSVPEIFEPKETGANQDA